MRQSVINQVQKLREQADITQEELARVAGVTRQTIIAIEKGNYVPSALLVLKIAKYFKKPVEEVFWLYEGRSRGTD